MVYTRGESLSLAAHLADGTVVESADAALDADLSARIFRRDAHVVRLAVQVPEGVTGGRWEP